MLSPRSKRVFILVCIFSSFLLVATGSSIAEEEKVEVVERASLKESIIAGENGENSSLILAGRRTKRKDPNDNFKLYTGGWNISNSHYWTSVAYTAAPFFVIAATWFVVFGLTLSLICHCYCCCARQPYGYSRIAYAFVKKKYFRPESKNYMPDFRLAFEHFCIHAGGRALIDELEKNLKLSPLHVEASRMTLHRFGNTSSSSIWYELAYTEAKGRMKKGDRIWQIALGSGFKCNSSVWVALRDAKPSVNNPWEDCVERYPVEIDI